MISQMIIVGLAAWRVASLLVDEDGPYNIFGTFREVVGIRRNVELTQLAKMFTCVWCVSIWTGAAFWGLWYVAWWIPGVFAAMGVAVMAHSWSQK